MSKTRYVCIKDCPLADKCFRHYNNVIKRCETADNLKSIDYKCSKSNKYRSFHNKAQWEEK